MNMRWIHSLVLCLACCANLAVAAVQPKVIALGGGAGLVLRPDGQVWRWGPTWPFSLEDQRSGERLSASSPSVYPTPTPFTQVHFSRSPTNLGPGHPWMLHGLTADVDMVTELATSVPVSDISGTLIPGRQLWVTDAASQGFTKWMGVDMDAKRGESDILPCPYGPPETQPGGCSLMGELGLKKDGSIWFKGVSHQGSNQIYKSDHYSTWTKVFFQVLPPGTASDFDVDRANRNLGFVYLSPTGIAHAWAWRTSSVYPINDPERERRLFYRGPINSLPAVTHISAAGYAVDTLGNLWTWGDFLGGGSVGCQLISGGLSEGCSTSGAFSAVRVPTTGPVAQVRANFELFFLLMRDGSVQGAAHGGGYRRCLLGLGGQDDDYTIESIPLTLIPGLSDIIDLDALHGTYSSLGSEYFVALQKSGSLWHWGRDRTTTAWPSSLCSPAQIPGFANGPISVTTQTPSVQAPQALTAQVTLMNDQATPLVFTPYLVERAGVLHAPTDRSAEQAAAFDTSGHASGRVKVSLAAINLAPGASQTIDVPLLLARDDATATGTTASTAQSTEVEFGVNTSDGRDLTALLTLQVSQRQEPAARSADFARVLTRPAADMGADPDAAFFDATTSPRNVRATPRATSRATSSAVLATRSRFANGWDFHILESLPRWEAEEKALFYRLTRVLTYRQAYSVVYLKALTNLRPQGGGSALELARGANQLWREIQKAKWGLQTDFTGPAKTIIRGLGDVAPVFILNLIEMNPAYTAPLVAAMGDRLASYSNSYARLAYDMCEYMNTGRRLTAFPMGRLVEADLSYRMTSASWHPRIHRSVFGSVQVRDASGQGQLLSTWLEQFLADYVNQNVPGCTREDRSRNWVRIQIHSPLVPLVTDVQGRRFGVDAAGAMHDEIPNAQIDPGHPWTLSVPARTEEVRVDYSMAYPYDFGIEVQGLRDGVVTSEHTTEGTANSGFSLAQALGITANASGVNVRVTPSGSLGLANFTMAERVFNWAQSVLPDAFPPGPTSQTVSGYYARVYPTGSILAVQEGGTDLLYFGPLTNATLVNLGPLETWFAQVLAAGF